MSNQKFTLASLSPYFHLPINEVAKELGVCATVLKKICRKIGIIRWPHRKVKSLHNMISSLERSQPSSPEEMKRIAIELEDLKEKLDFLLRNPNVSFKSIVRKYSPLKAAMTSGEVQVGKKRPRTRRVEDYDGEVDSRFVPQQLLPVELPQLSRGPEKRIDLRSSICDDDAADLLLSLSKTDPTESDTSSPSSPSQSPEIAARSHPSIPSVYSPKHSTPKTEIRTRTPSPQHIRTPGSPEDIHYGSDVNDVSVPSPKRFKPSPSEPNLDRHQEGTVPFARLPSVSEITDSISVGWKPTSWKKALVHSHQPSNHGEGIVPELRHVEDPHPALSDNYDTRAESDIHAIPGY